MKVNIKRERDYSRGRIEIHVEGYELIRVQCPPLGGCSGGRDISDESRALAIRMAGLAFQEWLESELKAEAREG
jgi:hypothetical protein